MRARLGSSGQHGYCWRIEPGRQASGKSSSGRRDFFQGGGVGFFPPLTHLVGRSRLNQKQLGARATGEGSANDDLTIRILLVEDSLTDVELAKRHLSSGGFPFALRIVDEESAFLRALQEFEPHVILSDLRLPAFDGFAALALASSLSPETPFIFLSAVLGEEMAVEALRMGAVDYVLKDRMQRLAPAVARARREAGLVAERRKSDDAVLQRARSTAFVASLSSRFLQIEGGVIENAIRATLEELGELAGLDAVSLYLFSPEGKIFGRTFAWLRPSAGIAPSSRFFSSAPAAAYRALTDTLLEGGCVVHEDVRLLADGERAQHEDLVENVASSAAFPMLARNRPVGFLHFGTIDRLRKWDKEVVWLAGMIADILAGALERRANEQMLEQERDFVTGVLDALGSLVVVTDRVGRVVRINEAFQRVTGYSAEEMNSARVASWLAPVSESKNGADSDEGDFGREYEGVIVAKNGSIRRILWYPTVMKSKEGIVEHTITIGVDLTEWRREQEDRSRFALRIERERRVTGLGRVAGMISHEFNNVLMGILPFLEVLKRRTSGDPLVETALDRIHVSVGRGRSIAQEILRFTSTAAPAIETFDLDAFLREAGDELRGLLGPQIDLAVQVPSGLVLGADPRHLHQVLVNLLLNARDAMGGEGVVTITVRSFEGPMTFPFGMIAEARRFVWISVADSGAGIPADVLGNVFEPLFTTKRSGTGLGLAITHQIVMAHEGLIFVESEIGRGTTFHLFFPSPESG
ncbi:MAG TPA: ATP-binding protein [Thermoanaerobaculia bacterium]|nr:ATP-binding protein [Thermoanaerobaculia bacterium]